MKNMISVVIPAYNEAQRIAEVVKKAGNYAEEVLVIDDRSLDGTAQVAAEAGVRVIENKGEKGYIDSVKTGFREAKGNIIITLDADGEHNPDEIPLMIQPILEEKADMVIGKREKIPRLSERLISLLTRLKTGIVDSGSGYRAIEKGLALRLNLNGKCICGLSVLEAWQLGAKIMEVPITINNIDKKRKIAWHHLFQLPCVLKWVIRPPLQTKT